jgi:hypothetical protein
MSGEKITNFLNLLIILRKKIISFLSFINQKKYPFYFFILVFFFIVYALILSQIKSYTKFKENNFNSFLKSEEFSNIKGFIFENIKSPYKEFNYTVENNDTLEKVLKKYDISNADINNLISEIIRKKLTNISPGAQIQIIIKKEKEINKIISLFYPVDAITSVEVKRNKTKFNISKFVL